MRRKKVVGKFFTILYCPRNPRHSEFKTDPFTTKDGVTRDSTTCNICGDPAYSVSYYRDEDGKVTFEVRILQGFGPIPLIIHEEQKER